MQWSPEIISGEKCSNPDQTVKLKVGCNFIGRLLFVTFYDIVKITLPDITPIICW